MADGFSPTMIQALFLAAAAAIVLGGCSVSVDVGESTRRTEAATVPVDGIRSLAITTENGSVDVATGDTVDIEVEVVFDEHDRGDGHNVLEVSDGTLELTGTCDARWFEQCSVAYRVVLPASTTTAIAVTVDTDNGRIDLRDLDGGVDAASDNGTIRGSGLSSSEVRARSDNGRVQLAFVAVPDEVEARSDNGAIDLTVPGSEVSYAIDASSDNGAVVVEVTDDPQAAHHITARTDNGAVTIRGV